MATTTRTFSFTLTVDGIDYDVEIEHGGDVITVSDTDGRVASAKFDHAIETVAFCYFTPEEGCIGESSLNALYHENPEELVRWLVSTHPSH